MNYVSYVTCHSNVFCMFIGNNNQQARNDRQSYIVIEIIKNVLRQKTHRLFNVALSNIEITLLYFIVHVFILYSICTKHPNTYQIFCEMFKL